MNMLARLLAVFALLVVPAFAQDQVQITTTGGEVLLGTPSFKGVEIETEFGSAQVRIEQIASITFGEPDVLLTRGQLELRGQVTFKSLRLSTRKGKRTVRRKDIALWLAVVDGRLLAETDVSGPWMTSFGPMNLQQKGGTVTGTYGYDKSKIEGTVSGGKLELHYGSGGVVNFSLWEDGLHMQGPWESKGNDGRWGAYRKQALRAEPLPGEIVRGQTESGLWYHLRVPKDYDPSRQYTAICILHGSNMSSSSYVGTFPGAWPELSEEYILVGFDGHQMNAWSDPGATSYNYTYVNFGGHEVGPAYAHRQSPALVAEGLDQLRSELPIERWLVGGHSQGGFLTYALAMFYPEKMAGVFPMSCNLLVQCDPNNFEDEEVRAAQRRLAFAPIHGVNDGVVAFSGGEVCYSSLVDGGFPSARFFTDEHAAHMFARLPVDDAIRWLDAMTSGDGSALVSQATEAAADKRWRDVAAAVRLGRAVELGKGGQVRLDKAAKALESAAKRPLAKLESAVLADRNGDWVEDFLVFREQFAFTDAAQTVMAAYAKLRSEHQEPADDLFWKQRAEKDEAERDRMRRQIVEEFYASSWFEMVKGWLE